MLSSGIQAWLLCASIGAASYTDSLSASGLIGDHFGVPGVPATFDYVVVGGGTAGLAMARRLSQDGTNSVAVVEAGDFYESTNGNNTQIPTGAAAFVGSNPALRNPLLDWYQFTEKQEGLGGRSVLYVSGKVLGGGSARNFLWCHRGTRQSFNKWAEAVQDPEYEFGNFDKYYKRSAKFTPPNREIRLQNATTKYDTLAFDDAGRPVQIGYPNWVNPISTWIAKGLESLGLKALDGLNSGDLMGYAYTAFTLDSKTQTRSSSESSYLREGLLSDTKLSVYKNTLAKKILFNDKTAYGVEVNSGGAVYHLNATKEVIVSGGAFRSPQLLMVSGVGPKQVLEQHGIRVVSDLPRVGQNMWDHIGFSNAYAVDVTTHSALANPEFNAEQIGRYRTNRTGQYTNCGGDILGFARLPSGSISDSTRRSLDSFASDWPDIEHLFLDGYFGDASETNASPADGRNYVSSSINLVSPFSRGTVSIRSADTAEHPIVDPR